MDFKTIAGDDSQISEAKVMELLQDFFQTGYDIKEFCFLNEGLDEATLTSWIEKYYPGRLSKGFIELKISDEVKQASAQKLATQKLFARIGEIELYTAVPAHYLKSLCS
jgi:hypothetical protein